MLRHLLKYSWLLLLLLMPIPGLAQDLTPERVQAELETTDRRIEQAQTLVAVATSDQANLEVQTAVEIQSRARQAFTVRAELDITLRLTLDARRHADRAIALVKGLPDPDRVQAQLERTQELLLRSRDRIEECGNDRARALIRAAFDMQARAEVALRAGRYLTALQLTIGARDRAQRALRTCRLEENLQETAERALRRTDEVIARAQERVEASGNDGARHALARALELQARAQQDYQSGLYEISLRQTQSARAFAFRAIRLSGGGM